MPTERKSARVQASTERADAPARSDAGVPATSQRDRVRLIVAVVLGALAVLFAALNFDDVSVNWLFGTWQTPLIVVIVLSFLLGAATALLIVRRRAKRD